MFKNRDDNSAVLAEHGRWIASLREDTRVMNQRLRGLERRVSTIEGNLANLMGLFIKLDASVSRLEDELR